MKQLAMMGGSFNPPHLGHIHAAKAAAESLNLDKVLFIPSKIPPHKGLPKGTPEPEVRFELTKLAVAEEERFEVSDIELMREGYSYTAVTARILYDLYPGYKLWLILGTDMLETFAMWYKPHEIVKYMSLAVVGRKNNDDEILMSCAENLRKTLGAEVEIIDTEAFEVSSTQIRELLCKGKTDEAGRFLPAKVKEYILRERLYIIHD
ncbi:MAG: nicotinate (nicotinamide) nucleotide adenylyltransferase [Clostridiales bacterium]|mgnify:CR=1 FL=1|nr:nicotinate (nicotinamide) nucleotide adenylyltransferase [Clostridiales bacterium]